MLKISELNKLESDVITQKVSELRKEIFDMKLQKSTTNLEKSHLLTGHKRDIARLLTVLRSKESK